MKPFQSFAAKPPVLFVPGSITARLVLGIVPAGIGLPVQICAARLCHWNKLQIDGKTQVLCRPTRAPSLSAQWHAGGREGV